MTDNAQMLATMKAERMATKAKLTALAKAERAARRRSTMLNKKAAKLSLQELLEISLVKYEHMKGRGEFPETEPSATAAASTGSASSSGGGTKVKAFTEMVQHAASLAKKISAKSSPISADGAPATD
jgi:hypothetical protein